jgi:hypothetical protein
MLLPRNNQDNVVPKRELRMARKPTYPAGAWPPRMPVEMAAGYCGERSAESFLARVGAEYPKPAVKSGRRQLWLKEDLDKVIAPTSAALGDSI